MQGEASDSAAMLYKTTILDHSANPRNFGVLEQFDAVATRSNLLCGDEITLYCAIQDSILKNVAFSGTGCAIMKASASLMTELLRGKTCGSALSLISAMTDFLNGNDSVVLDDSLRSLAGVRGFPSRIKCAFLPFQALHDILTSEGLPS
ncbi:MAG: Fe-S cluster assembly sulfur transfer protein SufU [Candidatus Kapaibacteriota bacterium]|jgi:nitrogen fixation NifU-like protein